MVSVCRFTGAAGTAAAGVAQLEARARGGGARGELCAGVPAAAAGALAPRQPRARLARAARLAAPTPILLRLADQVK